MSAGPFFSEDHDLADPDPGPAECGCPVYTCCWACMSFEERRWLDARFERTEASR